MPSVKKSELPKLAPKGTTIAELAKELKAADIKAKKFEAQMEQQKSLAHLIRVQKLPPLLEDIEGDGVNLPGTGYIELDIEVYPSIKKDDQETFFKWLRDGGNGALIVPQVHPKTLQAFVKEQLAENKSLPDYVNVAKIPTAKLKKEHGAKKKR